MIFSVLATKDLSDRQATFVAAIIEGLSATAAAERAGYAGPHHVVGWRLLRMPQVAAAVHGEIQRQLTTEDAPASLRVLRRIRDDETAPVRVRADIGLKLLQLAGHVAPSDRNEAPGKQLQEMSAEELLAYIDRNQAEIDRLEAELMSRAKDVSAPVSDPIEQVVDAKTLNYLD